MHHAELLAYKHALATLLHKLKTQATSERTSFSALELQFQGLCDTAILMRGQQKSVAVQDLMISGKGGTRVSLC